MMRGNLVNNVERVVKDGHLPSRRERRMMNIWLGQGVKKAEYYPCGLDMQPWYGYSAKESGLWEKPRKGGRQRPRQTRPSKKSW